MRKISISCGSCRRFQNCNSSKEKAQLNVLWLIFKCVQWNIAWNAPSSKPVDFFKKWNFHVWSFPVVETCLGASAEFPAKGYVPAPCSGDLNVTHRRIGRYTRHYSSRKRKVRHNFSRGCSTRLIKMDSAAGKLRPDDSLMSDLSAGSCPRQDPQAKKPLINVI